MKRLVTPILVIAAAAAFLLAQSSIVHSQSAEEKSYLAMYFTEAELTVISATRSLKSISQVAENVHVVTAADIELMNAHTLAEVLNTVTGVQVWMIGGPGSKAPAFIQGSDSTHVTVLIDGVVFNDLSDNIADTGMIPVQHIEKIEIIKGPASSTWGSALGGVVNIITKSGSLGNSGGVLSAAYGKKGTGDFRVEARGKQNRLGYYLTAGRLQSDGLTSNLDASENSAFAKLAYDITDDTGIQLALGYAKAARGDGLFPDFDIYGDNAHKIVHSTVAVNSALSNEMDLNVSLRTIRQEDISLTYQLSSNVLLQEAKSMDTGYGTSAKLTWKTANNTIVIGTDYDDKTLESATIADGERVQRKWAYFANNTFSLNRLSITPGIRHDTTNTNKEITSPSLGITYSLTDSTIIRAYAARGFSMPTLGQTFGDNLMFNPNPDLKMETVQSYQAGIETAAFKHVWVKLSAFRNDIRDALFLQSLTPTTFTYVNKESQRRQGFELEAKTAPVFNTSLSAGAEFIDAEDLDTGEKVHDIPTQVYDLGFRYDDETLKAMLKGRYINWNADPGNQGVYGSFVFDLNIIKNIYQHKDSSLEAFATAHNIFNGKQYLMAFYKNPERWLEGGIRCAF